MLPMRKIDSNIWKMHMKSSYMAFKDSLPDCQLVVRSTSARCMGPVLSITKVSITQTCCFKKIYPLCHLASFHLLKFNRLQEWWETISLQLHVCKLLMRPLFIIWHAHVTSVLNYAVSFKIWDNYMSTKCLKVLFNSIQLHFIIKECLYNY